MEKNSSSTNSQNSIIPYLFIFLLIIAGLTYYRIYIRHDYYLVPVEDTAVESQ